MISYKFSISPYISVIFCATIFSYSGDYSKYDRKQDSLLTFIILEGKNVFLPHSAYTTQGTTSHKMPAALLS